MLNIKDIVTKERLTTVGKYVKDYSKVLIPVIGYAVFSQKGQRCLERMLDDLYYKGNIEYDDIVKVILDSSMLSSYKTELLKLIRKDGDSTYYRTILNTVRSDMMTSYKIDIIKELNNN